MAEALLVGSSVGTGNIISVNGTATLVGHKLCISNTIDHVSHVKTVRIWNSIEVPVVPVFGIVRLLSDRAPPAISIVKPIAITPIISVGGDLSFGGNS